jgi:hypothetical protein
MKQTMTTIWKKITTFKIQELKIVRENDKEIKIIKFSFLGLAVITLLALGGYYYYNSVKIEPHNEAAIQYKANLMFDHIKNNTVLKNVTYQHNAAALAAFQTNPFVDRAKAGLSTTGFFIGVSEDKPQDSELFKHLKNLIHPKLDATIVNWELVEEAELLEKFVILEYYRCEILSIEGNFNVSILGKYIDSTGNIVLPEYRNQTEYDTVTTRWLRAVDNLIVDYNSKLNTINNLFTQLNILYATRQPVTSKYFENNSKKEVLLLRSYYDNYNPKIIKLTTNVIGIEAPMAVN